MKKKIAIIGSGISGLTCGYLLHQDFDIEIFEANNYIGGHTSTIEVDELAIDTGFIVFNDRTYPNFQKILDRLGVDYRPTEMSFSVRNDQWGLEYNGNNLNSLFAYRKNIINPKFIKLIYDILKFNRLAKKNIVNRNETLKEFIDKHNFGRWFIGGYILPMGSAIWSMGIKEMLDFPFAFFARFFNNHGLLDVNNRPQWYTICGGSQNYIPKLTSGFSDKIHLNAEVKQIIRNEQDVELIFTDGTKKSFHEVICACHSDQALRILAKPTAAEAKILGAVKYSKNEVVLHSDESLLPRRKLAHASWNYLITRHSDKQATLTYNMNILQGLKSDKIYCVTLNSNEMIAKEKIIAKFNYEHPIYTEEAVIAQQGWAKISGVERIHYCGAYWANGFHEDGVKSAIQVCENLGVEFAI
jgi:predicted NAD/FAD-binding protein